MYIVRFGDYELPSEQLEMTETQGLSRRSAVQPLGGAGGSFDHAGSNPDPLAEDSITKTFIIQAATSALLQTAIDDLVGEMMLSQNDWRQGARVLIAQLPDGTKRATWAKCQEVRFSNEYFNEENAWIGPVSITFRRSWPMWWKYEDLRYFGDHLGTFQDAADGGWMFGSDGNLTTQAVATSPVTLNITNSGNARIMSGLIEFDGGITNPKLENLTNGYSVLWTGTLGAGDRLTINIASYDVRKNGATGEWANVTLGTENGQLLPMVFEPGVNSLRVTGTSPNCTFRLYWARHYS